MDINKIDNNSGVHANVGFDFQRNTFIYLLLENYDYLKNKDYFIMLEHYDDIVISFLNSKNELTKVTTYQVKKASKPWTTNSLYEIIHKITINGNKLACDSYSKDGNYTQAQHFITNNTIKLDYKCTQSKKKKYVYINETNESIKFTDLNSDCQNTLKNGNSIYKYSAIQIIHFVNLNFTFIDLGRTSKSQLELLTGKFKDVFGNSILDHKAARDTLIFNLEKIESTFNQGNQVKLSDNNKKINSTEINEILNVLTTKKLALDKCRKKAEKICEELDINVIDAQNFELNYENSLDKFKDLTQGEHQKIFNFIEKNKNIFLGYTNDISCIKELYQKYTRENSSTLNSSQLKSTIAAGYFLKLLQK